MDMTNWSAPSHDRPRGVTILGSTGSVGQSTVDLIAARSRPLSRRGAGRRQFGRSCWPSRRAACAPRLAVVADPQRYRALKDALAGTSIEVAAGPAAVVEAATRPAEWVMAAIVGSAGLDADPRRRAARRHGGARQQGGAGLRRPAADATRSRRAGGVLLPVDSEHNAIFQVFEPRHRARHRPADPDGVGRTVPQRVAGRDGRGHARAGGGPSQLGHGRQDLDRFGHHDEQGPGADRGASAVRPAGASRSRSSFIRNRSSTPWSPIATARCWPSSARPTCACRSPHAGLAVAHRRAGRTPGFHQSFPAHLRTARFRPLSLATSGARGSGSGRVCTDRAECGQRGGRRGFPGATHRLPRHRSHRRGCSGGERHIVGSGRIRATGPCGRSGGTPAG